MRIMKWNLASDIYKTRLKTTNHKCTRLVAITTSYKITELARQGHSPTTAATTKKIVFLLTLGGNKINLFVSHFKNTLYILFD